MDNSDSDSDRNNFIIERKWRGLPFALTWARVNDAFLCFYQRRRW